MQKQLELDYKGSIFKKRLLQFRKKLTLRLFSTALIANSEATKEDLITLYGLNNKKVLVFHLLLSDDYDGNKTLKIDRQSVVAFVGRLSKSKRQEVLIREAAEIVNDIPDARFLVVGAGEQEAYLKNFVDQLSLNEFFEFTGSVPKKVVSEIMRKSKVHVSASAEEAFGLVNIEALSAGTPIVAPAVGGIKEIIQNGYNGLFYDPDKPGDLKRVISEIINGHWQIYSQNARKSYLDNFSSRKFKDQAFELIKLIERG